MNRKCNFRGELKQDMAGSAPLDMAQYRLLFGTSRVPKKDKDEIRYGNSFDCVYYGPFIDGGTLKCLNRKLIEVQ